MGIIIRLIKIVVMLALFVVLLVFAIGNSGLVSIKFLTYERTAPLVLVLFFFLIIGVVVGLFMVATPGE